MCYRHFYSILSFVIFSTLVHSQELDVIQEINIYKFLVMILMVSGAA